MELERRRRQAVQAVHAGEHPAVVARIVGVAPPSIYRWLKQAERPEGLAARPHPGRPPRLSPAQDEQLIALLSQGAQAHGWSNRLWTTARVAQLIQRHFGITFHHDHVGRFLRARLEWTPQKPRRRARERDEAAIRRWRELEFPDIAKQARQRGAHLAFLDESGFMLTPTVRRTWAPRGQTPILDCWDRRDRLSAISCITVSPKAGRPNLHFDILDDNKNVHAEDVIAFLRHLKAQVGGPLTVLWDGSRVHSRSGLVQAFLAAHPEIVVETLPSYAPELNPDELVWGWSKYGRLANLAAVNTDHLRAHVMDEMRHLKKNPQLLDAFITKTELLLSG